MAPAVGSRWPRRRARPHGPVPQDQNLTRTLAALVRLDGTP